MRKLFQILINWLQPKSKKTSTTIIVQSNIEVNVTLKHKWAFRPNALQLKYSIIFK